MTVRCEFKECERWDGAREEDPSGGGGGGECEARALLSELKELKGGRNEEKRGQRQMKYWKNIS